MDGIQQQLEHRYIDCLSALAECVARGVSDANVMHLASEAGIDRKDLDAILNVRRVS